MNLPLIDQQKKMIEEFQCPGCVCGSDTECGSFKLHSAFGFSCESHVIGTAMVKPAYGVVRFALGLPKGFCRLGPQDKDFAGRIRLWLNGEHPDWDRLNVAVWAMEQDGHLFVRTFVPRLNFGVVDVIQGGTLALCPQAINVSEFVDEID